MKHLHPKIRQKKKKWTLDQLKELIPVTITKSFNRICKQLKTLFVLKATKKVAASREQNMTAEYEKEVENLKQLKSINHADLAKYLSFQFFPEEISKDQVNDESLDLPTTTDIDSFKNNPKFKSNLEELRSKLQLLFQERETLLQKQRNIELDKMRQHQKQSALDSHKTNVKQAAVKAVFLDSLGGEDEEDNSEQEGTVEDDERKKAWEERRIQKNLRNTLNRKRNREEREKALEMYMPENQRVRTQQSPHHTNQDKRGNPKARPPLRDRNDRNQQSNKQPSFNSYKPTNDEQPFNKRQKVDKNNGIVEDENKLKSLVTTGKEWKETGVHPSWAAKQLQKTQISITTTAAPQGKKIVFDED